MYTNRFIKLPIKVYDKTHMDLTGEEITMDSFEMINPFFIGSYRPSTENNGNAVHVTFRDGGTMLIYLPINEFESTLNKHYADTTNHT